MQSVLTGGNITIQCTGKKKSLQQDSETFSEKRPLAKIRCVALMDIKGARQQSPLGSSLCPRRR
jgi:hypothetical protein